MFFTIQIKFQSFLYGTIVGPGIESQCEIRVEFLFHELEKT